MTIFNISDLKLLGLYLKRMFGMTIEGSVTTHAMDKLIMLGHILVAAADLRDLLYTVA